MPYLRTPLDDLLSSRSKLRLLRQLVDGHDDLSGRELARRAAVSWRAAYLALRELVQLGVVRRVESRAQARYTLVKTHALVRTAVVPLFEAERAWGEIVRRELAAMLRASGAAAGDVRWAGLYGSVARGDDRPDSDLDIAVVASSMTAATRVRNVLREKGPRLLDHLGRVPSIIVDSPTQWRKLIAADAGLRRALTRDAIRVFGETTFEAAVARGA